MLSGMPGYVRKRVFLDNAMLVITVSAENKPRNYFNQRAENSYNYILKGMHRKLISEAVN